MRTPKRLSAFVLEASRLKNSEFASKLKLIPIDVVKLEHSRLVV